MWRRPVDDQVKGIGDEAPDGWALQVYQVPLPSGLGRILAVIREILAQGKVQSLQLELGKPITFTKFVKEEEAEKTKQVEAEGKMSLGDIARNVMMEEYEAGEGRRVTAQEVFLEMMLAISARRLHVTHIGLGTETNFFKWLGIDQMAYGGITNLAGAEIVWDKQVPGDNLLLAAGPNPAGPVDAVTFVMKAHMRVWEDEDVD